MVARFQSPLLFAWAHLSKQEQRAVAKKLELAEATGFSFFLSKFN
jgi:hypothetical protein